MIKELLDLEGIPDSELTFYGEPIQFAIREYTSDRFYKLINKALND